MSSDIKLHEFFNSPKKFNSVKKEEIITKYLEESLKDKSVFINYLQLLYREQPWAIHAIIMSAPNSVYALKPLFEKEAAVLPPTPKYEYGSQTIMQFINLINSYMKNKGILSKDIRNKILYTAVEVLSKDDYNVFSIIMEQKINPKVYEYIEQLFHENNLPLQISKYFLFSLKPSSLCNIPSDLFANSINAEYLFIPNGELRYFLVFNNICVGLDKNNNKFIIDEEHKWYSQYNDLIRKTKIMENSINTPAIYIADDNCIIARITNNEFVTFHNPVQYTELVFGVKICEGINTAFVVRNNEIVGTIGYDNNTLKRLEKEFDTIDITSLPFIWFKGVVIDCKQYEPQAEQQKAKPGRKRKNETQSEQNEIQECQEQNVEKVVKEHYTVFSTAEKVNKINKESKKIKLVSLLNNYYFVE